MNALKKCIFQTHLSLLLDFHNLSTYFFDFWIKNCDSTVESDASLLRISIYIYGGEVRWSWKSFRSIWSGIWHSLDILSLSFSFFIPFLFSISLHLRNYLCKWSLYTIFFNYATLYSLTVLFLTLVWVCFFIYLFIWVWSWMMTYYIRLNFMVWKEFMVDFFNDIMFFRRPSDGHVL